MSEKNNMQENINVILFTKVDDNEWQVEIFENHVDYIEWLQEQYELGDCDNCDDKLHRPPIHKLED